MHVHRLARRRSSRRGAVRRATALVVLALVAATLAVGASTSASAAVPTITGVRSPAANANGWNNTPVLVSFNCAGTALVFCTPTTLVATDGSNQSVTGRVTDVNNVSNTATVSGINVDRTVPMITGTVGSSPSGAGGWYKAPVQIIWSCADALSGVANCPSPTFTQGEGASVTAAAVAIDRAGNLASGTSPAVKVDAAKPSTTVSSPPTWSKADVTLALTATDALSGVALTSYRIDGGMAKTGTAPVVSGQGVHTVEYWSTDVAGNVETAKAVTVRIDVQAPSITASASPGPNAAGWNNGPVTVSFTCGDEAGGSGVASCSAAKDLTGDVDTTVTGTASDNAGNSATVQQAVRIDQSAPVIEAQVPLANADGWFDAPVQVGFTCSDTGGSGIATCPSPVLFAGEGRDQPVTGEAFDAAGNRAQAAGATVSLDTTDPVISGAAVQPAKSDGTHDGTVTIHWTCADALSGVVACPADQQVAGEGVHVVTGSVTDRAGNTSSADVTIRINRDASADPGVVHGTITDAVTGRPVKNATVILVGPYPSVITKYTVKTGTDGTYVFPLVADGSYKLAVVNWGVHLQSWWPDKTRDPDAAKVTVAHGSNITADQALTPGYVVQGDLRGPAGEPLAGATVRLQGIGADFSATSDAAGHYAFTGQVPDKRTVSVYAYGYEPSTVPVDVTGSLVVDRTLTPTAATAGVKGRISALGLDGAPLDGATVRVWMLNGLSPVAKLTTGADGRFQLPSMPAGTYQFDVIRPGYQVRWYGDTLNRGTATVALGSSCTSTPDASWGDPCAASVNIRMIKP